MGATPPVLINAAPPTWLIDRKGILRYCDLRGAKLRQAVEELIKESLMGESTNLKTG